MAMTQGAQRLQHFSRFGRRTMCGKPLNRGRSRTNNWKRVTCTACHTERVLVQIVTGGTRMRIDNDRLMEVS